MDDDSGLELSLMEGMDEDLLVRLHEAGVRTRHALEVRISTDEERRRLAQRIEVPPERLAALHFLNFLPPEIRAARFLALEQGLDERAAALRGEVRRVHRLVVATALGAVGLAILAASLLSPGGCGEVGSGADRADSLAARVAHLERETASLRPLARAQADARLLDALSGLGPIPGWNGPLAWSLEEDERLAMLLGETEGDQRERAASILLARLALIENAPLDSLGPSARGRLAAEIVLSFASPDSVTGPWDAAGVLLRQRLRARSLGFAPPDAQPPLGIAAAPWSWTAPGFLAAEELLARAEALPVRDEALPLWSETLVELRRTADMGRESLGDRPEAWARYAWLRRAEIEFALTAAALGHAHLHPYHDAPPEQFLAQRRGYLESAAMRAPAEAQAPLRWLLVECEEADRLVQWMLSNPTLLAEAQGKRWVQALETLEAARARDGLTADPELAARVRDALAASGSPVSGELWAAPRTRWEAGLRPIRMVARDEARRPSARALRPR